MREKYLATYTDEIARAYPARHDGKVMLKFPRLFILAVRYRDLSCRPRPAVRFLTRTLLAIGPVSPMSST